MLQLTDGQCKTIEAASKALGTIKTCRGANHVFPTADTLAKTVSEPSSQNFWLSFLV